MRFLLILGLLYLLTFTSCQKDSVFTTNKSAKLTFSTDSVLFDTIFTTVGSTTRRLKVFNPNKKAIRISEIKLEGSGSSAYQLNINGQAISQAKDVELAGLDSLTIFIRVNIDPGTVNLPFIVTGTLSFLTNGNTQLVQLAAYGQNAHFLNEKTINQDAVWDDAMPYVIYKSVLVNENVQLTIKQGARIYFHKDSKLLVAGTLLVQGLPSDTVTFCSDRLEHLYREESGQWTGVHFLQTSKNNQIHYATIKNALIGIQVDSSTVNNNPKLILTHSIVKNMEIAGIALFKSDVNLYNNLFYNCGQYLVYGVLGGNYALKQNTFAAYNYNFSSQTPALYFADNFAINNVIKTSNLQLKLINNIITGSLNEELVIDKKGLSALALVIQTNLIKTKTNSFNSNGNILNTDPLFIDPRNGNYQVTNSSPVINKGTDISSDSYFTQYLSRDIKGKLRIFPSELGCYENL